MRGSGAQDLVLVSARLFRFRWIMYEIVQGTVRGWNDYSPLPTMPGFSFWTGHGPLGTVPRGDEAAEYSLAWNREKTRADRAKHGVSFEEADTVFQDPQTVSVYSGEHSNSEARWATPRISAIARVQLLRSDTQVAEVLK